MRRHIRPIRPPPTRANPEIVSRRQTRKKPTFAEMFLHEADGTQTHNHWIDRTIRTTKYPLPRNGNATFLAEKAGDPNQSPPSYP